MAMTRLQHLGRACRARLEPGVIWIVGHAAVLWAPLLLVVALALSWHGLRQVTIGDFRGALHDLELPWLALAAAATALNLAVMGLYDVVAFKNTRMTIWRRWTVGAVAFAWSNMLTFGPLAGPAVRFWLYRSAIDDASGLRAGIAVVSATFVAGLAAWILAVAAAAWWHVGLLIAALIALVIVALAACAAQAGMRWLSRPWPFTGWGLTGLIVVGWLDWLLALVAFMACAKAAGSSWAAIEIGRSFFFGQGVGIVSMIPGGFGSSDLYWLAHLGLGQSTAAAVLMVYRVIYYVLPWITASLLLLSLATVAAPRRVEIARRVIAGLVGAGGVLIMLSSASPALHARIRVLRHLVPLPLVETGYLTAVLAGLVLLAIARALASGYRVAFRTALLMLLSAATAAILKGLDWEEAVVLVGIAALLVSQARLFDRPSRGDWIAGSDLLVVGAGLLTFIAFGIVTFHVGTTTLDRIAHVDYGWQATRFLRTAASLAMTLAAVTFYLLMRSPVGFRRLDDAEIETTLTRYQGFGRVETNPLMVATGDKAVFRTAAGFCLYRTIGPYLVVFSDPAIVPGGDRAAFLDELFAFAADIDRRVMFYQVSVDCMPALHDRGYQFFKLGEQADVMLDRVTLDGHAGKLYRQLLRRAERDGIRFEILPPAAVAGRLAEMRAVSDEWMRSKQMSERQFSLGFFDEAYLQRFPCAIVEEAKPGGRLLGFANLLEGPSRGELSVDLMRYLTGGPQVMDFMLTSILLDGKARGFERFNLGMAPLAAVGDRTGAHLRERLARLMFEQGQHWYNFQGLRQYKQKFQPEWRPRYMAYQTAWEWPMAIACVSALIAGGWGSMLSPASPPKPQPCPSPLPQLAES